MPAKRPKPFFLQQPPAVQEAAANAGVACLRLVDDELTTVVRLTVDVQRIAVAKADMVGLQPGAVGKQQVCCNSTTRIVGFS